MVPTWDQLLKNNMSNNVGQHFNSLQLICHLDTSPCPVVLGQEWLMRHTVVVILHPTSTLPWLLSFLFSATSRAPTSKIHACYLACSSHAVLLTLDTWHTSVFTSPKLWMTIQMKIWMTMLKFRGRTYFCTQGVGPLWSIHSQQKSHKLQLCLLLHAPGLKQQGGVGCPCIFFSDNDSFGLSYPKHTPNCLQQAHSLHVANTKRDQRPSTIQAGNWKDWRA